MGLVEGRVRDKYEVSEGKSKDRFGFRPQAVVYAMEVIITTVAKAQLVCQDHKRVLRSDAVDGRVGDRNQEILLRKSWRSRLWRAATSELKMGYFDTFQPPAVQWRQCVGCLRGCKSRAYRSAAPWIQRLRVYEQRPSNPGSRLY